MTTIKISNWLVFGVLIGVCILIIALAKGCQKAKGDKANIEKLLSLTDSLRSISKQAVEGWKESKKQFEDSLEFERGQRSLVEAQKERTEDELNKSHKDNMVLLLKYEYQKYQDTSMVSAPREFVEDCHDCFTKLSITDKLSLQYKKQVSEWGVKYERETMMLNGRYKQVERERDSYYRKVDSLSQAQEKAVDKIKQKGRLYLSWGVLWRPWPQYAGAGILYQTKQNMIYGAKCYYGTTGYMVETTLNFPLSLKSR